MLQAGFSSIKIWWKNEKQITKPLTKKLSKLQIDSEESAGEEEEDSEEEESEEEKDELSGDEMEEYQEVERIKQTKRWKACIIGLL